MCVPLPAGISAVTSFFPLAGSAGSESDVSGTYWTTDTGYVMGTVWWFLRLGVASGAELAWTKGPESGFSVRCVRAREGQAVPRFCLAVLLFVNELEKMDHQLLEALFRAYFKVRRISGGSHSQLDFEMDMERNLIELRDEIAAGTYEPSPSICFMLKTRTIRREIFAPAFRDRVVHHMICDQLAPLYERCFIADSYACRKGKGTRYAVERLEHHIRSCSENYTRPCYVLKLDIQGYFFAIDRSMLFEMIRTTLDAKWDDYRAAAVRPDRLFEKPLLLALIERILSSNPASNYVMHGNREEWKKIPPDKSLFHSLPGHGLPVGSLTSQLFSNIYMDSFDQYVKRTLKIKHYGRYVDDFFIVHEDQYFLQELIPHIRSYLKEHLHLTLHPRKIYLQEVRKGVGFVGAWIKPFRTYPGRRIIKSCNRMLYEAQQQEGNVSGYKLAASLNSYLGSMKQYDSYRCRRNIIERNLWIYRRGWMRTDYAKFTPDKSKK